MLHPAIFLAQILAGIFFLAGGKLAEGMPELGGLFSNTYLTFFCAGGSCCGGALYVIFNAMTLKTPESSGVRAFKFIASVILGMCFTPWLIHTFNISEDSSSVLAWSTAVGFLGWSIILVAFPTVVLVGKKVLVDSFRRFFGLPSEPDPPTS